jgi:hypothetical protein
MGEENLSEGGGVTTDMLAVVHDEQELIAPKKLRERQLQGQPRQHPRPEQRGDGLGDERPFPYLGEFDQPHPSRKVGPHPGSDLQGEARLSNSTGTYDGHKTFRRQLSLDVGQSILPAH